MNSEKYHRQVQLLCPTCGSSQFEDESAIETVKCASCGREITRDDLERENSENINAHIDEMTEEALRDAHKEIENALKRACSGSKHVKFKMR